MTRNSRPAILGFVVVAVSAAILAYLYGPFITFNFHKVPEGYQLNCYVQPKPVPLKIEVTK